ncbi:MAG: AbrB/MazE/SpoVT family DNA-binding domain-containing protein [Actinomycetia bacterium]|nr:AbrB/MazE/SpoVT family DNA-binding domain-containing protein [Actinomycetota bacterium]MCG2795941.1 AbrB/MazE/SpoVT family DNA-binding domain-containing protein [Actinomycetes bacterium]
MPLMRVFVKVDDEGRIPVPENFRREVGLKPGQLIEIKLHGNPKAQWLTVHKRKAAR